VADRIVVDTNVIVAALRSPVGSNRRVVRYCAEGRAIPLMGEKLFQEYESLLSRKGLFEESPLSAQERREFLDGFLSLCEWINISFLWRPNLMDEGDNHVLELAIAGMASKIITNNAGDFRQGELRFPSIHIVTPGGFVRDLNV
jgi:putative PIN family toxin of toxin-antitoxin system